jgi:hypothetical protein
LDHVIAYRALAQAPPEVRRLLSGAESTSFDLGSSWFENLASTVYASHPGVRFYVLFVNGKPVIVLPIVLEKRGRTYDVTPMANYYSGLYAPIIGEGVSASQLAILIRHVARDFKPVSSWRMSPMDVAGNAFAQVEEALQISGWCTFRFYCFGNWFLTVDGNWPDYFAHREGALRSTIKRMGKKFAADGGRLESVSGGDALEKAINAYATVYASSWKVAEPFTEFVPGLIRVAAQRGWLRLGIAWLKDEPIAAQIWIVNNGKASVYKLAYHQQFKAYAPGTLLTAKLMQHVFEADSVSEVDYMIGDDAYKKSWMNERRERWGIIAFNPKSLVGALGLLRELASRLARAPGRE